MNMNKFKNDLVWPYNMLAVINALVPVKYREWITKDLVIPTTEDKAAKDIEGTITYIICELKCCELKTVSLGAEWIIQFFKYNHTMSTIAKRWDVSHALVSNNIRVVMEKIGMCLKYRSMLVYGLDRYYTMQKDKSYRAGYELGYSSGIDHISNKNYDIDTISMETPIEYADLSTRAFNCLKRGGYNTLGDLLNEDIDVLYKLRNCGRKVIDEMVLIRQKFEFLLDGKTMSKKEFEEQELGLE